MGLYFIKAATQAARRPFPMQPDQSAKQTPSDKHLFEPIQWCNFNNLHDLECPKSVYNSLFYNRKNNLWPFGRCGGIKPGEEKGDWANEL